MYTHFIISGHQFIYLFILETNSHREDEMRF